MTLGFSDLPGTIHTTSSYSEWQAFVRAAPDTSQVLLVALYQTLRDDAGQTVDAPEVMAWTVANSPIPVVGIWEFAVQEGALGGSVISGFNQGYEAGQKASQILNGTPPSEIPVSTPKRGKLVINSAAAARWDVKFPLDLLEVSTVYGPDGLVVNR
jgi:ABC-type uncharacterized transport system substrate-binding protein